MDAEIHFFMTAKDQADFLEVATNVCDSISISPDTNNMILQVAASYLIFTPSPFDKYTLYKGSLEIRSSSLSAQVKTTDIESTKIAFRKLRNWLKKHYWSRLAYINQNKKGKLTPSRNYWLGPDAKKWKETSNDHILKLSATSWMIFEIGY